MLKVVACLILLFILPNTSRCQDSLYLIGTITGESTENNITDVKGIGDVNDDEYEDYIVISKFHAKLYLGSSIMALIPGVIFHYPGKDSVDTFFVECGGIGDANGDGYADFAIRGSFSDWGSPKGKVFVYLGGKTIDTIPKYEFYDHGYRIVLVDL